MTVTDVIDGCRSYMATTSGVDITTIVSANHIVKYSPRVAVMLERRAMPLVAVTVESVDDTAIAVNGHGGMRHERLTVAVDVMWSMTYPDPADDQADALELVDLVAAKLRYDPTWGFLTDGGRAGLDLSGRWLQDPASQIQDRAGVLWWRWTTTAHLHPLAG